MFLGFGSAILLLILISAMSWWQMAAINDNKDFTLGRMNSLSVAHEMNRVYDTLYLDIWALVMEINPAEKQKYLDSIESLRSEYVQLIETLRSNALNKGELELYDALESAVAACRDINNRVIDMALQSDYTNEEAQYLFATEGMVGLNQSINPALKAILDFL